MNKRVTLEEFHKDPAAVLEAAREGPVEVIGGDYIVLVIGSSGHSPFELPPFEEPTDEP